MGRTTDRWDHCSSVCGTSSTIVALARVLTPLLGVLQVFGDRPPGRDPVPANLGGRDHLQPTEPPQEAGAEPAAGRRLIERDQSLVQRPLRPGCCYRPPLYRVGTGEASGLGA